MEFPKTAKPWLCASDDVAREHMSDVYLEIDESRGASPAPLRKGRLVATSGHTLAIVPVTCDDHDTAGYVPIAALKAAAKLAKKGDVASLAVNGSCVLTDGSTMPRGNQDRQFPPWRTIVDSISERKVRIGVNPYLLYDACLAIGCPPDRTGVTLEVGGELDPIKVTRGDATALVMPMRI
jgi:hypothetical protein